MVTVNDEGVLLLFQGERFSGNHPELNEEIEGATHGPMEQARRQSVMLLSHRKNYVVLVEAHNRITTLASRPAVLSTNSSPIELLDGEAVGHFASVKPQLILIRRAKEDGELRREEVKASNGSGS